MYDADTCQLGMIMQADAELTHWCSIALSPDLISSMLAQDERQLTCAVVRPTMALWRSRRLSAGQWAKIRLLEDHLS